MQFLLQGPTQEPVNLLRAQTNDVDEGFSEEHRKEALLLVRPGWGGTAVQLDPSFACDPGDGLQQRFAILHVLLHQFLESFKSQ